MLTDVRIVICLLIAVTAGCGGGGGSSVAPHIPSSTSAGSTSVAAPLAPGTSTPARTASPTPAPAGAATPTATATPAVTPTPIVPTTPANTTGGSTFATGTEWPTSFTPYGPQSVWNQTLPANPQLAGNSAQIIASMWSGPGMANIVRNNEAGPYDYGHPVYFAQSTDPVVNVVCGNCSSNVPSTIHIPAKAYPAGGTDGHLVVIQPDMTEIDFYCGWSPCAGRNTPWQAGQTISAGYVANVGSFITGTGMADHNGVTAMDAAAAAGLMRANELLAGQINHALFVVTACAIGTTYPTPSGAGTDACTSGVGPPLGATLWYDVPDATTNANPNLAPWEKAILNAGHDHGWIVGDDVAGGATAGPGVAFMTDSNMPSYAYGLPDPWAQMTTAGWSANAISRSFFDRYTGADQWSPNGVNFAQHMHVLSACVVQKTC